MADVKTNPKPSRKRKNLDDSDTAEDKTLKKSASTRGRGGHKKLKSDMDQQRRIWTLKEELLKRPLTELCECNSIPRLQKIQSPRSRRHTMAEK